MNLSEKIIVYFRSDGKKDGSEEESFFTGAVEKKTDGDITLLSVNVHLHQLPHVYARIIDERKGVCVDVSLGAEAMGALSRKQYNPFWSMPHFEKDLSRLSDNIQNILIRTENEYIAALPLTGEDFNTTIIGSDDKQTLRFCMTKCYNGAFEINGAFAVLAADKDPFLAVKKAYQYACDNNLILTRMREEKTLNCLYKGLGWCTWNAFYRDVCEKSIFEKLDEFKEKQIPVKWIIIDDGWNPVTDDEQMRIKSFKEDQTKFPSGLKACVERMKREYGIEKVGVWHALTAYWFGVEKNSELYNEQKNNLTETNSGFHIPNGEKAYNFFSAWYKYLKAQGIDFVKIDAQGNSLEFLSGKKDCIKYCRDLQKAVDEAANEYFGGNVINCMAMNNVNVHNRPYSSLARSSDDFLPDKPESFASHIMQNAYNSVFHGNLLYCDYDMWQSYDVTAKRSSILRAISGGPIYLSDEAGKTEDTYIKPLLNEYNALILCDDCALPMQEHLFENPDNNILKLINKKGDGYVVAVFNLSDEKKRTAIQLSETNGEYVAYGYYSKKFYKQKMIGLELDKYDAEIINFYPVKDGNIYVDDLNEYISAAGKRKISVSEL